MALQENCRKIFQNIDKLEPSPELEGLILARINFGKRRSAKIKAVFSGIITLASLAALISTFQYALYGFYQSGFYQYFSLIFSDGGSVLAFWREFAQLLAESLPLSGTIIFLSAIFIFFGSIRLAVKNIKAASLSTRLSH